MGFLSKLFDRNNTDEVLLGDWLSDIADQKTLTEIGDVKLTFRADRKLIYEIRDGNKRQIINMTYWIKGNIIISDQPSHPKKEETEFRFEGDDTLILKFSGEESRFVKKR